MTTSAKVLLIILDGFGEGKVYPGNAVSLAKTPTLTKLRKENPWTLLKAAGQAVGIPDGTQGGSEVGHFTIGSGRVTLQTLEEVNDAIADGSFFIKPALVAACQHVNKAEKSALHLLGMISDQGVHSHIAHLFALLQMAKQQNVQKVYIHAITDGRDVPGRSVIPFIQQIQEKIKELGMQDQAKIATIMGRYFAMDRDSNLARIQPAYDLLTLGKGVSETDPVAAIKNAYAKGVETDYYIEPILLDEHGVIKDKDAVIFWNFRSDRARELTWCFTGENNLELRRDAELQRGVAVKQTRPSMKNMRPKTGKPINFNQEKVVRPFWVCMGPYSEKAPVVFPTPIIKNNLSEVISHAGLKQLRLAETQKYAHVTYFLNSQIEKPFPGEDRIMIDSKRCHSYAEMPEMSAREITDELLDKLKQEKYEFIALNFANCDLVGHSGDLKASIKAVEVIDECLGKIIPVASEHGYVTMITGDHGNVEYKIYEENGEPCPSHTKNPVPFILVGAKNDGKSLPKGELKDIAPTILKIMGMKQPPEMTGQSLIG